MVAGRPGAGGPAARSRPVARFRPVARWPVSGRSSPVSGRIRPQAPQDRPRTSFLRFRPIFPGVRPILPRSRPPRDGRVPVSSVSGRSSPVSGRIRPQAPQDRPHAGLLRFRPIFPGVRPILPRSRPPRDGRDLVGRHPAQPGPGNRSTHDCGRDPGGRSRGGDLRDRRRFHYCNHRSERVNTGGGDCAGGVIRENLSHGVTPDDRGHPGSPRVARLGGTEGSGGVAFAQAPDLSQDRDDAVGSTADIRVDRLHAARQPGRIRRRPGFTAGTGLLEAPGSLDRHRVVGGIGSRSRHELPGVPRRQLLEHPGIRSAGPPILGGVARIDRLTRPAP